MSDEKTPKLRIIRNLDTKTGVWSYLVQKQRWSQYKKGEIAKVDSSGAIRYWIDDSQRDATPEDDPEHVSWGWASGPFATEEKAREVAMAILAAKPFDVADVVWESQPAADALLPNQSPSNPHSVSKVPHER